MIFSNVRISQLKRERVERELAFRHSREALEKSVRSWANPMAFIRDNPGFMTGSGSFLLSVFGLGNGGRASNGNGHSVSGLQRWGLKLASFGATLAGKSMRPFGAIALRYVLNKVIRRFQA